METLVAIANIANHSQLISLAAELSSFNFCVMSGGTLASIGNVGESSAPVGSVQ